MMQHPIDRRSLIASAPLLLTPSGETSPPLARTKSKTEAETVIDVRSYGAIGDGVTDDTPAIQAAINAMAQQGGGTVYLPNGIYGCRLRPSQSISTDPLGLACLCLKSNVCLKGDGSGSTLRLLPDDPWIGPGSYMRMIMSDGALQNVTLSDFTVDFNIGEQRGYQSDGERDRANGGCILLGGGGLATASVADTAIIRIHIVNGFGQAIQVAGHPGHMCNNIRISECTIADSKYIGIQVSHAHNVQIIGNNIEKTRDNAIDFYGDDGSDITTTRGIIVQRNTISRCLRGVFVETASFSLVADNIITDCADSGIQINRIVGEPRGILVCDNIISGGDCAIRVAGECDGVVVRGNLAADFRKAGFELGGDRLSVSYVMIEDNVLLPSDKADAMMRIVPGTIGANFLLLGSNYLSSASAQQPIQRSQWLVDQGKPDGPRVGNRLPVFIGFAERDGPDLSCRWAAMLTLSVEKEAQITSLKIGRELRFETLPPIATGNAQAAAAGLATGQVYRTPTGQLMVRF